MSIFDCPLYSPRTPEGGILQDPRGQKGAAMLKEGVSRRVQGGQRNRKEVRTQTTWVQGKWAEQRVRQPYRQSQQALGNLLWKEGLGWEKVNGRAVHCPLPRRALPSTPVLHWHSPLQGHHQCLLWLPADPPLTSDLSRRGPVCASIFTTSPPPPPHAQSCLWSQLTHEWMHECWKARMKNCYFFSILLFLPDGENFRKINDCDDKYILNLGRHVFPH